MVRNVLAQLLSAAHQLLLAVAARCQHQCSREYDYYSFHRLFVILYLKFITHLEILMEIILIPVHNAQSAINRRHPESLQQMPPRNPKVIRCPVQYHAVAGKVKLIVPAADAIIFRLQQILVLVYHSQAQDSVSGYYELG